MSVNCLDELLVSMFLDDELAPGERKRVETHLETCTLCRELVRQREAENAQIKEIFKTTPTPDLVPAVMEKLGTPGLLNYRWILATAASILLVGFLFIFFFLITPTNPQASEKQVILCSAQVDGQEVQSHIYQSTGPDIQFIWLEKKNEKKEKFK
ncbi:MAG: zf-HC2 domain-containing protein [Candidatus Aminicenantes bacterium]